MSDVIPVARRFGLLFLAGLTALLVASSGLASAQKYLPDGPDVPVVTLSESQQGAAGLPPLPVPPPHGWDQESIWNMQVIGFNDNQGRPSSDDGWIENQDGRYILYVTDSGGSAYNPLTHMVEPNGTSLIDVTDPRDPKFVHHIPSTTGSASHVAVCGGNTLPNAEKDHWYMLRHDGSLNWQVWDTTKPDNPAQITTIISNGKATHHVWWECDTGIAYLVFQQAGDGWHTNQHVYIYDLSNPANPKFIRQWGIPGQQPSANVASQQSCSNAPSSTCFEGVVNPPTGVHEMYSAGQAINRVYFGYGSSSSGIAQIVDREKLLNGCNAPEASSDCANNPSQADLLYPQISYLTANPLDGVHTFLPIFGVPIPQAQQNYLTGAPVRLNLAITTSEATSNDCAPQKWKDVSIIDISNEQAPWPISSGTVGQFPGAFCAKGSRFGPHELSREIYPPYYGKLVIASFFNAGVQVFDIRDPYNPRRVAYFIQAPNANTKASCGTYQGNTKYCRNATFSDLGEVDDRGFIYSLDRAGSGVTVLKLTGNAANVVAGQGSQE